MLERRDEIVERVSAKEVLVRRVRIGVTELTALTWLMRLTVIIKETYPNVIVEAEVELSATLRDRLATDTVDLIVVPQAAASERFASIPVGTVENAWMCSPSLHSGKAAIPIADIAHLALLLQGNLSGTELTYSQFLSENGVSTAKILVANSLVAQIGLTVAGLGVSYQPKTCLNYMITAGIQRIIKTKPALPPVHYVALHRAEHAYSPSSQVAQMAQQRCDFNTNPLDPWALSPANRGYARLLDSFFLSDILRAHYPGTRPCQDLLKARGRIQACSSTAISIILMQRLEP
jgi:DNA-binding transcriptional LysR family regulator